jgi:transposase
VFHLVGLNLRGEVVVRKKFSRLQLLRFTANRQIQLIGMEACGGSHFLGRALREQGHEVRLIPAQYVKPYVKTNKSDYIDAEAIAEAVGRPTMRFVPIKTDDQLDLQSLHRVRERWVMRRTAVVNQIRGLLLERGITLRKGRCHLDAALPGILEDGTSKLSGAVRLLLAQLKLELDQLAIRLEEADALVQKTAQQSEVCRRLDAIPGIGPLTATALVAAIGNGAAFRKGREFAAWVGLVPREHSTGGKQKLLGISKRGNSYLRRLFVQGARAVLQIREKQSPGLSAWLAQLTARTHYNVAGVALANKPGAHGLGRALHRRSLSATCPGLQMTPGPGQAWKSHARFPHPLTSYYYEFIFSCQVCWRTMRWHNGRTRRSENPYPEEVFQDCQTNGEKNAAHSILARSYSSNEGRIHLRRPTCHFHFFACNRAADHTFRIAGNSAP